MRIVSWLCGFIAALALGAPAAAEPVRTPHVEMEFVSSRAAIAPGETFEIALRQRIIPGWHTYWTNPGDSGEPTELTWTLPAGFQAGPMRHPPPVTHAVSIVMTYVHEGEVFYPIAITAPDNLRPGQSVTLSADGYWLVCSDICLTEEGRMELTLPVEAAGRADQTWGPRITEAIAALPQAGGLEARITPGNPARLSIAGDAIASGAGRFGNLYFFPHSRDAITHIEPQAPELGARGVSFSLTAGAADNLGQAPLAGVVVFEEGGQRRAFEIAAAPGEALAETSGTQPLGAAAAQTQSDAASGLNLPLALLFAFIGGLILNVMPCVLPVLSLKAVQIAQSAQNGAAQREGLFYLAGVMATFLALAALLIGLRAGGQSLGWAFQLQEPWLVAALALLFFGIGLNLIGAFEIAFAQGAGQGLAARGGDAGAFFTGALVVIVASPCTAPFMAGAMGFAFANSAPVTLAVFIGLALGFAAPIVLICFAPGLRRLIPKPGAWMARFRQVLAFAMFGAAVWLFWVLNVQTGPMGALALLSLALTLAFLLFVARWGRIWLAAGLAALLIVGAFAWRPLTTPVATAASETAALQSEPWSAARVAALRAEGRPVFVNFTAAWCITCQVNERVALQSTGTTQAFTDANVAYLKGDWTNKDEAIAAELARHGRAGVPLYLYYAPGAEAPRVLPQMLSEGLLRETVAPGS
ncbi:MAG: protein-disulfide reductase DsbD family protein [Hyphomonadaceae bacterium]